MPVESESEEVMGRLTIEAGPASVEQYGRLESGDILYFPVNPIPLPAEDRAFLLGQGRESRFHKHISYRPAEDRLKGINPKEKASRTHQIMRDYSRNAIRFMASLLPRYAGDWKIDLASFRPFEEQGRNLRVRARNDLIHIDNFPSRPSYGDCLLRIFTNINPERSRIWVTSESFEPLAWKHAAKAGLPLGPLHEESYVHVHEARGDAYGFGGLTQERRYIAGKLSVPVAA